MVTQNRNLIAGTVVASVLCWLHVSAAHGGFIEVFTDNNNDNLIDHDLEPTMGANYMGVPTPTNSEAGYNAFVSALGPNADIGIEDFESFTGVNPFGVSAAMVGLGLTFDRIPPQVGSLPVTAQLTGTGLIANLTAPPTEPMAPVNPDNESGRFPVTVPVGGDQYFSTNFDQLGFTITFSTPVSAFGFFGTDFGDFNGQSIIKITDGDDTMHTMNLPHQRTSVGGIANFLNASLIFYGVVGDNMTIKSVNFSNQGSVFDRFGFDNLVVATTSEVPEPGSMVLLASGLMFGAIVRRRRISRTRNA